MCRASGVIPALDVRPSIEAPLSPIMREGFDDEVLAHFRYAASAAAAEALTLADRGRARDREPEGEVKIAIVGKYTGLHGRLPSR
jgi:CTP synthase